MKGKWFLVLILVLFSTNMSYAAQKVEIQKQEVESKKSKDHCVDRPQTAGGDAHVPQSEDDEIYLKVDKKPEFPGGQTALDRYIKNNLRYPVNIGEMNLHGRIVCEFVVNKDGAVSDIEVVRSNYPAMNAEVLRVLREMPQWTPGLLNEVPVRVKYTLPVNFHLP